MTFGIDEEIEDFHLRCQERYRLKADVSPPKPRQIDPRMEAMSERHYYASNVDYEVSFDE